MLVHPENPSGSPDIVCLVFYLTEGCVYPFQAAIGPSRSNRVSRGFLPVFLKKPLATCDFPKGSGPPLQTPFRIPACIL